MPTFFTSCGRGQEEEAQTLEKGKEKVLFLFKFREKGNMTTRAVIGSTVAIV